MRTQLANRFEGEWNEFVTFNKPVDIRPILEKRGMMAVSRWNNAVINQRFIRYNFRPKTEWPEQSSDEMPTAIDRPTK